MSNLARRLCAQNTPDQTPAPRVLDDAPADPRDWLLLFPLGSGAAYRELAVTSEQLALLIELGVRPTGPVAPLRNTGRSPTMGTGDLLRYVDRLQAESARPVAASIAPPAEFAHASIRDALASLGAKGAA